MRNGAENFRRRAQAGIFQKGFAVTLAEPVLSEMAGCAGYDFVFIDAEHAPLGTDVRSVESTLQMGAQWGVCGIDTELMAGAMRACLALFEGPADF